MNRLEARPPESWTDAVERVIREGSLSLVRRVAVVAETRSTQDAALAHAAGKPGLLLLAGRQTGGRGRLGRPWADGLDHGIAATFVLDSWQFPASTLAIAAGLAAHTAATLHCPAPLGVRWPNDVVDPSSGRKLAGVLVELAGPLALVGIGINVTQADADWSNELRAKAASLHQLGGTSDRLAVILDLLPSIDRHLALREDELARRWRAVDTLIGSTQTFSHDGRIVRGLVEDMDPTARILVKTDSGERVSLPALTTSLVKD